MSAIFVLGLHTKLLGQDTNDITELKTIIANLEEQIERKDRILEKIKEDVLAIKRELSAERKEKERLIRLCREAGISFEKTEDPIEGDYQVCQIPIKPAVLSDSMRTLGFTKIEVGELGWVSSLKIEQIVDSNNAIVEVHTWYSDGSQNISWGVFDVPSVAVRVRGVQMEGFADDTTQKINHYFAVTGTKTYKTAIGGSKTLCVIEPVILSPKRLKQETQHYKDLKKQYRDRVRTEKFIPGRRWPKEFSENRKKKGR